MDCVTRCVAMHQRALVSVSGSLLDYAATFKANSRTRLTLVIMVIIIIIIIEKFRSCNV